MRVTADLDVNEGSMTAAATSMNGSGGGEGERERGVDPTVYAWGDVET